MNIGVLCRDRYDGRPGTLGSSLIRGDWLVQCQPETFEYFVDGRDYELTVFQKVYDHSRITDARLSCLDLCDDDWRRGLDCESAIRSTNIITCPTRTLAKQIGDDFGIEAVVIPDRILPEWFTIKKVAKDHNTLTAVWFGWKENWGLLDIFIPEIYRLSLNVVVISNEHHPRFHTIKYNRGRVQGDLVNCADLTLNPSSPHWRFAHKSNNKEQFSHALGIPCATTVEQIEPLLDFEFRKQEGERCYKEVRESWHIRDSCRDYINLTMRLVSSAENRKTADLLPD